MVNSPCIQGGQTLLSMTTSVLDHRVERRCEVFVCCLEKACCCAHRTPFNAMNQPTTLRLPHIHFKHPRAETLDQTYHTYSSPYHHCSRNISTTATECLLLRNRNLHLREVFNDLLVRLLFLGFLHLLTLISLSHQFP